jgi:PAS domain S-box-containing protein
MMTENIGKDKKKETMKEIIRKLHEGLSVEEAKEKFEQEVGDISSTEIAEIEQSLINEGLPPEEIKKFCNVHALLFKSALEKTVIKETSPSHPVYLFKLENREIEKITQSIKDLIEKRKELDLKKLKTQLNKVLAQLKNIDVHYERKEQILFPFLEREGFFGPSKVMWSKDNEIRELHRKARSEIESVHNDQMFEEYLKNTLEPLLEETEGMIFKEENILFPTSIEKLNSEDWVDILKESDDVGYVYIEKPKETESLMKDLRHALQEEALIEESQISFPTGTLHPLELMSMLNTLPVDITFVDKDDKVRYFSDKKDRTFVRTRSVIGRQVQNCHPPQSVDVVEKILSSFKKGRKKPYDFWINLKEKNIYIRYFPVRDNDGNYMGTLEVTHDITEIKKLEGEKRLVDERD